MSVAFVSTEWDQRFDDIAFDGGAVEHPEIARATNDLLHSTTRLSLALLTGVLVLFGLGQRWRLALVVGASIIGAVVTMEVSKFQELTRPDLDGVAGSEQNSFPSGHVTIGMALAVELSVPARRNTRPRPPSPIRTTSSYPGNATPSTIPADVARWRRWVQVAGCARPMTRRPAVVPARNFLSI